MKSFISILLIGILLFNLVGYRIVYSIATTQATNTMEATLENNRYHDEDLVSFKISANKLPYYTNSKLYEIANGEVDVNGVIMTYVKKRIFHDSIEYLCLPNIAKTNLRTAKDDFFKLVNDLQNSTEKTTAKTTNKNIKPFSFEGLSFSTDKHTIPSLSNLSPIIFEYKNPFIPTNNIQFPQQPPELA